MSAPETAETITRRDAGSFTSARVPFCMHAIRRGDGSFVLPGKPGWNIAFASTHCISESSHAGDSICESRHRAIVPGETKEPSPRPFKAQERGRDLPDAPLRFAVAGRKDDCNHKLYLSFPNSYFTCKIPVTLLAPSAGLTVIVYSPLASGVI